MEQFALRGVVPHEMEQQEVGDHKQNLHFSQQRKGVVFPMLVEFEDMKAKADDLGNEQNDEEDVGVYKGS